MRERNRYCVGSNHVENGAVITSVSRQVDGRWAHSVYETVCFVANDSDARRIADKLNRNRYINDAEIEALVDISALRGEEQEAEEKKQRRLAAEAKLIATELGRIAVEIRPIVEAERAGERIDDKTRSMVLR